MTWIKQHPAFWATVLLVVAALAVELRLLQRERIQARRAVVALERVKLECDRLGRQSPALSEENEQAIGRDLAGAEETLVRWRSIFLDRDAQQLGADEWEKTLDAYFDIAAFVEKTRAVAAHAQVTLKPNECFGFAAHANEGPAPELARAVLRQRLGLQYLVETLIEARPLAVLAVQREQPMIVVQRARSSHLAPTATNGTGPVHPRAQSGDFFEFAPDFSLRVPGLVASEAFRLEFTGPTHVVRDFLNSLTSFSRPLVIRSVEVEPLNAAASALERSSPPAPGAPVPLVAQSISRFAVVVEFIEPVAVSGKPAP